MVWHFIGVYIINRTLHDRLEIRNFSSRVEKYFTRSLRSLVKYFSTLEEKFCISAWPCNILYFFFFFSLFALEIRFFLISPQPPSLHFKYRGTVHLIVLFCCMFYTFRLISGVSPSMSRELT